MNTGKLILLELLVKDGAPFGSAIYLRGPLITG